MSTEVPRKLEASLRGEGDLATGIGSSLGLKLGGQDKDSRAGWLVGRPAIELYRAWANRRLGTLESRAATALLAADLKHLQRSQPWSSPDLKPHPSTPLITES